MLFLKGRTLVTTAEIEKRFMFLRTTVAILISFVIAFLLILCVSNNPLHDMLTFLTAPLSTPKRMGQMVEKLIPLLFTGTAMCLMNAGGQINIAVEGAFFGGAVASTCVAILPGVSPVIHYPLCILAGGIVGAIICGIPGWLNVRYNILTIVSSLMMNYIALYLGLYVILNLVRDPAAGFEGSYKFAQSAKLGFLIPGTKIHVGLILGIAAVIMGAVILNRTKFGYELRTVGCNPAFAKYSGIAVGTTAILTQLLAGFIAGAGGTSEVLGLYSRFSYSALTQHGFDGVMIAVVARNKPKNVPLAALFLAYIRTAADILNRTSNMPTETVKVVQAVVMIFIAAESLLSGMEHRSIVRNSQRAAAATKEG